MKSPLTHALAAVTLTALLTVPTHAGSGILTRPSGRAKSSDSAVQGTVLNKDVIVAPGNSTSPANGPVKGKLPETDVIVDPATRPAQNSRVKNVKLAHRLRISHFGAKREANGIAIRFVLTNFAQAMDEQISYRILRMERGRWVDVPGGGGNLQIAAGGSGGRSAGIPLTNEAVKFRLDITANAPYMYFNQGYDLSAEKEPVTHTLAYGTNGWVLAYEREGRVETDKLRADAAIKLRDKLAGYGFAGRIRVTTGPFGDTEHVWLWINSPMQTREFATVGEALEFAREMKSHIKDSVGVWSRVDPQ